MFRLPRTDILRGYRVFSRILAQGRVVNSGTIKLFYTPQEQPHPTKVGFTVSRSVGGAVLRNRMKRWLREAYRKNRQKVRPPENQSIVLMYTGPAPSSKDRVDYDRIEKDLLRGLQQLRERILRQ